MSINRENNNPAIDSMLDYQKSNRMTTISDKDGNLATERKLLVSEEAECQTPIEALLAAAEAWVVTRVGFQLLRCLGLVFIALCI